MILLGNTVYNDRVAPIATNHSRIPPGMRLPQRASLADVYEQADTSLKNIEAAGDYSSQVTRCREIWDVYGNACKYPEPIVALIMDMMVSATVAFGTENMLRGENIDFDHPAKKMLDHYCATVNMGNPMLTPGLDAARKQMHRQRWCDGGVVVAWDSPVPMTTDEGIKYRAPAKLAMLPRTQFEVKGSDQFGGFELVRKGDLSDLIPSSHATEIEENQKVGEMDDFLSNKTYFVFDRGRSESSQKYPVPYLEQRGVTVVLARKRAMQRGDYNLNLRLIRAILLMTQGSDAWVQFMEDWNPYEVDFSSLKDQLSASGGATRKDTVVLAGDYTMDAKYVQPDTQAMMSADKFSQDNMELLAGLGILEIRNTGERRTFATNTKPLVIEIVDAMQDDRRLIENILFRNLWDLNPKICKGLPIPKLHQKPIGLLMDELDKQIMLDLFDRGILTYGSTLEHIIGFGADIDSEAKRSEYEKASGFDEIFENREVFRQGVTTNTEQEDSVDDEKEEARLRAGKNPPLLEEYDKLKEKVRKAAKDGEEEDRRRAIASIVMAVIGSLVLSLKSRVWATYAAEFNGEVLHRDDFEPYVNETGTRLEGFGSDLLEGKGGSVGIYTILSVPVEEIDAQIDAVFGKHRHRLGLYEREPFKVARIAAQAASASAVGMTYAVRHSEFTPTTCAECIQRHGEIVAIMDVLKGNFDHPNGVCFFTYHTDRKAANLESGEMLTIDEINAVCGAMDDDQCFAEV